MYIFSLLQESRCIKKCTKWSCCLCLLLLFYVTDFAVFLLTFYYNFSGDLRTGYVPTFKKTRPQRGKDELNQLIQLK